MLTRTSLHNRLNTQCTLESSLTALKEFLHEILVHNHVEFFDPANEGWCVKHRLGRQCCLQHLEDLLGLLGPGDFLRVALFGQVCQRARGEIGDKTFVIPQEGVVGQDVRPSPLSGLQHRPCRPQRTVDGVVTGCPSCVETLLMPRAARKAELGTANALKEN